MAGWFKDWALSLGKNYTSIEEAAQRKEAAYRAAYSESLPKERLKSTSTVTHDRGSVTITTKIVTADASDFVERLLTGQAGQYLHSHISRLMQEAAMRYVQETVPRLIAGMDAETKREYFMALAALAMGNLMPKWQHSVTTPWASMMSANPQSGIYPPLQSRMLGGAGSPQQVYQQLSAVVQGIKK